MKKLILILALSLSATANAESNLYDEYNRYTGYIDDNGYIYDAHNRVVGRVETKRNGDREFIDTENRVQRRDSCRNCPENQGSRPIKPEAFGN